MDHDITQLNEICQDSFDSKCILHVLFFLKDLNKEASKAGFLSVYSYESSTNKDLG